MGGRADAPRRSFLAVLAVAVLGAVALGVCLSRHGPMVAQVGVHNLAAADDIAHGAAPRTSRGESSECWPPLMPLVLAGAQRLGISPIAAAGAGNALAYGVTLAASGYLVLVASGSLAGALVAQVVLLTSPALFSSMVTLQYEPWFLAFLALALAGLAHSSATGHPTGRRIAAAAMALACLQRYAGLAFLAVQAIWIAASAPTGAARTGLRRALWFAAVGAGPVLLWMLRNALSSGHPSGVREPSFTPFSENLSELSGTLAGWLSPPDWGAAPQAAVLVLLAVIALAGVVRALARPERPSEAACVALLVASTAGYIAFLLAAGSATHLDPLRNRLCLPALPFLVSTAAIAAVHAARRATGKRGRWLALALAPLAVVALERTGEVARLSRLILVSGRGGLNSQAFPETGLRQFLAETALDGPLLTNLPEFVWLASGREAEFLSPVDQKAALSASALAREPGHIVWITRGKSPALRVKRVVELELLARFPEGAVYRTRPLPAPP